MEGLSACECPVCFRILNHTTHEPMSMPCGHTLCKMCVDQLGERASSTATRGRQTQRPTFQCPICRVWVNSDAVSLNVTLRDLLSELGRMDEKRVLPLGTALNVVYSDILMREELDRGAFGEVCRGSWRGNDVAIKLFSAGRPTPETMESFQREVFVMNCLRHPNVVLLLGACQTPPKLAIIMEYVAGGSLHQLVHVDKRVLSVSQTASLATDISRGLQYLHSINVLHRDLKSKNVLLTGPIPCQAKLCDFGLSRMRLESATMTGNIGTVHWTAPEVFNNERYRFSADVYGFGMVLYEMMSGRVPLGHMIPMAVMMAVAIRRERPAVPDNAHPIFKQIFSSCTEWVPENRPSLPSILISLSDLLVPHPQLRGAGPQQGLQHQDSLGVIFLSATDSADLMNQDTTLPLLVAAQQNQATPNDTPTLFAPSNATPTASPPFGRVNKAPLKKLSHDESSEEKTPTKMSVSKMTKSKTKSRGKKGMVPGHVNAQESDTSASQKYRKLPHRKGRTTDEERTSLNMAVAMQSKFVTVPPPGPRKSTLGEGSTPWPGYVTGKQKKKVHGVLPVQDTRRHDTERGNTIQDDRIEEDDDDMVLAINLQAQLDHAQLEADRELAKQLQMKENSFQATGPTTTPSSVFPPQPLLDSIKSKMFPQLKHVETTPTQAPPTDSSLKKRLSSLIPRSLSKKPSPSSSSSSSSRKKPVKPELVTTSLRKERETPPPKMPPLVRKSQEPPGYPDYQNIGGFSRYDKLTAPPVKTHVLGAMSASSPPPPPPPPPPPSVKRFAPSPRQLMLKYIRAHGANVVRKLRPVQTVEKRAFRVGLVVGGYDQQKSQYTTQNLIQSFNKRWLRPVAMEEPPPPFPVGRVVHSRLNVKRLSSTIKLAMGPAHDGPHAPSLPPPSSSPPRRRLHPAIRTAVERFSKDNLHHVETVVRQKLPDVEELSRERRSKLIEELLDFDRSLLVAVDTAFKNKLPSADVLEIERRQAVNSDFTHTRDLVLHSVLTFDPKGLHHVVTEVKNCLPSIGTIELEKKIHIDEATPTESHD